MSSLDPSRLSFLWWILVAVPGCAAAGLALRWLLGAPWRRGDPAVIARRLPPAEAAVLMSGPSRAVEAAVVGLYHRGAIRWSEGQLARGLVAPGQTSAAEAFVLSSLPVRDEPLLREARRSRLAAKLARALEVRGLFAGRPRRARWIVRLPALAWLAAIAGAVGVGIATEPRWELLVTGAAGGAGAAILLWLARAPRLTHLGRKVAQVLRTQRASLEETARSAPHTLTGGELAMAYAVFGPRAAPDAVREVLPGVHAALLAAEQSPRIRNLAWLVPGWRPHGSSGYGGLDWEPLGDGGGAGGDDGGDGGGGDGDGGDGGGGDP